jgi:hypothetical protein
LKAGLVGEFGEESVGAVVGGPDGEIVAEGDAALGGFPEEFGVGMPGEFVDADIAAINGHSLGMGGEGEDTGFVVEFDDTDFDFIGEGGGLAVAIEARDAHVFLAVGDDGAGEIEELGEAVSQADVFNGAGIIFGDEKVITAGKVEAFADIFEGVAIGPADADGFFGEGHDLFAVAVKVVLGFDPGDLVGQEVFGEEGGVVEGDEGKDGGHGENL